MYHDIIDVCICSIVKEQRKKIVFILKITNDETYNITHSWTAARWHVDDCDISVLDIIICLVPCSKPGTLARC